jgi:hypothetical protein
MSVLLLLFRVLLLAMNEVVSGARLALAQVLLEMLPADEWVRAGIVNLELILTSLLTSKI